MCSWVPVSQAGFRFATSKAKRINKKWHNCHHDNASSAFECVGTEYISVNDRKRQEASCSCAHQARTPGQMRQVLLCSTHDNYLLIVLPGAGYRFLQDIISFTNAESSYLLLPSGVFSFPIDNIVGNWLRIF